MVLILDSSLQEKQVQVLKRAVDAGARAFYQVAYGLDLGFFVQIQRATLVYDATFYDGGCVSVFLDLGGAGAGAWARRIEARVLQKLRKRRDLEMVSIVSARGQVRLRGVPGPGASRSLFAGVDVRAIVRVTLAWVRDDRCGIEVRLCAIEALDPAPKLGAPLPPPPPPPPGPPPPPPPPLAPRALFRPGNDLKKTKPAPQKPWVPTCGDIIDARNRLRAPKVVHHLQNVPRLLPFEGP